MIYADQESLDAGLAKWAKILRLQDWEIRATIKHTQDMGEKTGRSFVWPKIAQCAIEIGTAESVRGNGVPEFHEENGDMEATLVHELLHIHFDPFAPKTGTMEYTLWERAIEVLARVLVGLDRQSRTITADNVYAPGEPWAVLDAREAVEAVKAQNGRPRKRKKVPA